MNDHSASTPQPCLDPILPWSRAVYENQHIDASQFMDKLDGYARRIDEDVEKVCSRNYQVSARLPCVTIELCMHATSCASNEVVISVTVTSAS